MKLEVSKDFVMAAHAAACTHWKEKIETEFPSLFTEPVKLGYRYQHSDGDTYILCRVDETLINLIGLETGNRWSDHVKVVNPQDIKWSEFRRLIGNDNFKKI